MDSFLLDLASSSQLGMPKHLSLGEQYSQACQELNQPENPYIIHILEEVNQDEGAFQIRTLTSGLQILQNESGENLRAGGLRRPVV